MHLAYVTSYDSKDVTRWSGTGFYISKALEDQGISLTRIGGLRNAHSPINISRFLWNTKVRGLGDHPHRDPGFLRNYARQVKRRLDEARDAGVRFDAIFAPGVLPIAFLETDIPIVIWTDCTFAGLLDYYPAWTNLSARSVRDGHEADRRALQRADLLIFTSDWAAKSAMADYGCSASKIHVVPLGANVGSGRTIEDVRGFASARLASSPCRLLLPGVNWHRKGCDFAVKVTERLNEAGFEATLDIVGCNAPEGRALPSFVRTHGFVSKATPEGRAFVEGCFRDATVMILPTIAECTAVVFNEAASFGLPVFTTDTGGTPSIVRDGKNGFTYPVNSDPNHWARDIIDLLKAPDRYEALCLSAFDEFRMRLNWDSAGQRVKQLMERMPGPGLSSNPPRARVG